MNTIYIGRAVRSMLLVIAIYVYCIPLAVFSLFAYTLPKKICFLYTKASEKFLRESTRIILGVNTDVRGLGNLPDGPCILAMKHQSAYDVLFPFRILDQPAVIVKKELLRVLFGNIISMRMDMIFIDRSGGAGSMRRLLDSAKRLTDGGRSVVIFPEGTRTQAGAQPDYKPGVALLYSKLQLPCVPVALNSGVYWMGQKTPTAPGGRIVFDIQQPIPAGLDKKTFMLTLQDSIETACARLGRAP